MDVLPRNSLFSKNQKRNRENYIALYNYTSLLPDIINIVTQYIPNNSLIILGGEIREFDSKPLDSVILYDALNDDWIDLPSLPITRCNFTSLVFDNKIFVMGGFSPEIYPSILNRVDTFDISVFQWVTPSNLKQRRFYCTSCVYHDIIYVIGGIDSTYQSLNSIEVYDPKQPLLVLGWTIHSSKLNIPRFECISVVFNHNIYVIGGCDRNQSLDSIEMYDSVNDIWLFAKNLSFPRSMFSAVATKDYIYVMGGCDTVIEQIFDTVERSDMKSPWVSLPSTPEKRCFTCSTLIDNTIYLVGGKNTIFGLSTSIIFAMDLSDPNPTWSTFNMPHERIRMSCVSAPIFL